MGFSRHGVGCHALLQWIFLTRDQTHISLSLLHWQVDSLPLATFGKQGRMWKKKKKKKASGWDLHPWEGSERKRRSTWVDLHSGEQAGQATILASHSWDPAQTRKTPLLLGNSRRQTDRRRLDSTHKECVCAGSLTVRAKTATGSDGCHFTAFPKPNRQMPWPPQSTPQTSVRSGQRLGLAMQRQTRGPEVWSGGAADSIINRRTAGGGSSWAGIASMHTWWHHKRVQILVCSSLFPSKSTLGVLEWFHPLHTTAQHYIWGRKRRLGEDPIEAAQISGDKAAPAATTTSSPVTAQHSPALDLGWIQQRKGREFGLLLSTDVYTGETQVFCDLTDLTCFRIHLPWGSVHTQGLQSMIKPNPQPFYSNNWGVHPIPNRMMIAMELRRSLASYPAQAVDPTSQPHFLPIQGITTSPAWGKTWWASIPKSVSHQRTGDTESMQGQPYIKTSLQDHSGEWFLLNSERQKKVSKI